MADGPEPDEPGRPPSTHPAADPLFEVGSEDDTLAPHEIQAQRQEARLAVLEPGSRLGEYEIVEGAGAGAMGVVYRARSERLGHDVALKVLDPRGAGADARERFRREAQAAGRLAEHPHVAGVHDAGETDGFAWFAMELVEGPSLLELIRDETLNDRRAVTLLAQAARAIHHGHELGVFHRDLKPSNLMVAADGDVRVTDFGLASVYAWGQHTQLTMEGSALGTPAYMAPEQARGEAFTAASDVYGLGATLYHALTSVSALGASSLAVMFQRATEGQTVPAREARPDLPRPLVAILDRALAADASDRYPTAAELADDLQRWLDGRAVRAGRAPTLRRAVDLVRRHPVAATVLVILVGAVGTVPLLRSAGNEADRRARATADAAQAERIADAARARVALWQRLASETRTAWRTLEDRARGVATADDAIAAAVQVVQQATDRAASAHPESALPAAWNAAARWHATADPSALTALRVAARRDGTDPFPPVLLAAVLLGRYADAADVATVGIGEESMELEPFSESDDMKAWRIEAANALSAATGEASREALGAEQEVVAFVEGATALADGRAQPAAAALASVVDHPILGGSARLLRGVALVGAVEPDTAAREFEHAAERGWPSGRINAAMALMCHAVALRQQGSAPDAIAALDRAAAHLRKHLADRPDDLQARNRLGIVAWSRGRAETTLDRDPTESLAIAIAEHTRVIDSGVPSPGSHVNRAHARTARARWLAEHGGDPRTDLRAAVADLTRYLELLGPTPWVTAARGSARLQWGIWLGRQGADPSPQLRPALDDFAAALAAEPARGGWYAQRGTSHSHLAEHAYGRGADPRDAYRRAIAEFDLAEAHDAVDLVGVRLERARCWNGIGNWWLLQGDPAAAAAPYQRASDGFSQVIDLEPAHAAALVGRGGAGVNLGQCVSADGVDPEPVWEAAVADLRAALRLAPDDSYAWYFLGNAGAAWARHRDGRREGATAQWALAVEGFEAASRLDARLAAALRESLAEARAAAGG